MKKTLKILLTLFSLFLLLVAGAAIAAKLYFPAEKVRSMAEAELSGMLREQVRIREMSLSLTRGLEAKGISIGGEKGPLQVERIYLEYSPSHLLKGKLLIHKMGMDRPTLFLERVGDVWNFEKYLASEKTSAPATGFSFPFLPLAIDVQSFEISGLSLRVKDELYDMNWEGFHLTARLAVSLGGVEMELAASENGDDTNPSLLNAHFTIPKKEGGSESASLSLQPGIKGKLAGTSLEDISFQASLGLHNVLFKHGEETVTSNSKFSLDSHLNLEAGEVKINKFAVDLTERSRVQVSGAIHDIFGLPSVELAVEDIALQLDPLTPLARPFSPALRSSGKILVEGLNLKAALAEDGEMHSTTSGKLTLQGISAEEKDLGISLLDLNGHLKLDQVKSDTTGAFSGALDLDVTLKEGDLGLSRFQGLSCRWATPKYAVKQDKLLSLEGNLALSLESLVAPNLELEGFTNGVQLHLTGENQGEAEISAAFQMIKATPKQGSKISTPAKLDLKLVLKKEPSLTLAGKLDFPRLEILSEKLKQTTSLAVEPNFTLLWEDEKLVLHSLTLDLPGNNKMNMRGSVDHSKGSKGNLNLDGVVDLDSLAGILSSFFPHLKVGGKVTVEKAALAFEGDLPAQRFQAKGEGAVHMENLDLEFGKEASLRGLAGDLRWKVDGSSEKGATKLAAGFVDGEMDFSHAKFLLLELNKAHGKIRAGMDAEENVEADFGFRVGEVVRYLTNGEELKLPFHVQGKLNGNAGKRNLEIQQLKWAAGKIVRGETTGSVKNLGKESLEIQNELWVDMGKAIKLPGAGKIAKALKVKALKGNLHNNTSIQGKMSINGPEKLEVVTRTKLSKAAFAYPSLDLSMRPFELDSTLKGQYNGVTAKVEGEMRLKGKGLSSSKKWRGPPLDLDLSFQSEGDISKGTYQFTKFLGSVKNLMKWNMEGEFAAPDQSFAAKVKLPSLRLSNLKKFLPPSLLPATPEFQAKGEVDLSLAAKGTLPNSEILKLFPGKPLPLTMDCKIQLKKAGLSLPEQGLEANEMDGPIIIHYGKEGVRLKPEIFVAQLELSEGGLPPFFIKTAGDFLYQLPDGIQIKNLQLWAPAFGFHEEVEGEIHGLSDFLLKDLPINLKNILTKLDASLTTRSTFHFPETLTLPEGTEAKGKVEAGFLVKLNPKKDLTMEGQVEFDNFNLRHGSLAEIKKMHGSLPLTKKFYLGGKAKKPSRTRQEVVKSMSALGRTFFPHQSKKEKITMESVKVLGQETFQVRVEPSIRSNAISLDRVAFKALGGYAVGSMSLESDEDAGKVRLNLEFAGLDSRRLLKMEAGKKSVMNGNLVLQLPLPDPDSTEDFGIGMMDLDINLTRIGEESLDHLLRLIDPKESNPGIVDLRSKLKLATPVGASVQLKHGALSVSTQLKLLALGGGIHKVDALERVPMARLSGFGKMDSYLEDARVVSRLLQILFADEINLGRTNKTLNQ